MKLLACDSEVKDMDNVLNDLNLSCDGLRRVRDTLTNEDGWNDTPERMIKAVVDQGILLAAVVLHMENLINQGFKYEFARREAERRSTLKTVGKT